MLEDDLFPRLISACCSRGLPNGWTPRLWRLIGAKGELIPTALPHEVPASPEAKRG